MRKLLLLFLLCLLPSLAATADDKEANFSDGFFIVNEDWYGHCNSTINWFGHDGRITKRVVQTVNGQAVQLGCTAPVGVISNGRMYVTSKQAQDPGASVAGGRLTVLDATTMNVLSQFQEFPNGGDGRDVCAVSDSKVYVGSTQGIYILDTQSMAFAGMVSGSETAGDLYYGQVGTIVAVNGMAYAVSQDKGLLVIDPNVDMVVETLAVPDEVYSANETFGMGAAADEFSFGSVVYKDGFLWLSVAATDGMGGARDCLVKFDPATKAMTTILMPADCHGPANSWYAWTPDGFCASAKDDYLFWNGGDGSWFAKQTVYRYNVKTGETKLIIDLQGSEDYLYGCCLRVNPETGDVILGLNMGAMYGNSYEIRIYTPDGDLRYTYVLDDGNYWFPSVPLFPQVERSLVANEFDEIIVPLNGKKTVDVTHAAHDNFLTHALMGKGVQSVADADIASADMADGNTLSLTGLKEGRTDVSLKVTTDAGATTATIPVRVVFQYLISAEAVTPGSLTFTGTGYYSPGETATITATPAYGYEFAQWSDGVTTATREVAADADKTLRAEVRKQTFTITVKAGAGGSVQPSGEIDAEYLDELTLTAVPDEHYVFVKWNDRVKTAERTVTVTKDCSYQANFEGKPDQIVLSVAPEGAGSVSGAASVKYGGKTYVKATAKKGYKFVSWSDGETSANRYVYGQGETIELTANFEPLQYSLTVTAAPADGGEASGAGTYDYGSDATLTATPAEGYVFTGWADGETEPTRTVTVSQDASYVANFGLEAKPDPTAVRDVDSAISPSAVYDLLGRRLRSADGCRVYVQDGRLRLRK